MWPGNIVKLRLISYLRFVHSTGYGVLDLKFSTKDDDTFAVAASNGSFEIFLLNVSNALSVTKINSLQICNASILLLSLDWCPIAGYGNRLAVSLSDGRLAVIVIPSGEPCFYFKAHSLEAWSIAWDSLDSEIIYSGGDDAGFCVHTNWDRLLETGIIQKQHQEAEVENVLEYVPFSRDLKIHGAGVTAILPIDGKHDGDVYVITGSYDEYLRVLKRRGDGKIWHTVVELLLGGGVWRLNLIDKLAHARTDRPYKLTILASCMHAGPKVVQLELSSEGTWNAKILAQFLEHESMNYASDVAKSSGRHEDDCYTVVSSSFYDKKICVWCLDMRWNY